jgi:hypothetical protein
VEKTNLTSRRSFYHGPAQKSIGAPQKDA